MECSRPCRPGTPPRPAPPPVPLQLVRSEAALVGHGAGAEAEGEAAAVGGGNEEGDSDDAAGGVAGHRGAGCRGAAGGHRGAGLARGRIEGHLLHQLLALQLKVSGWDTRWLDWPSAWRERFNCMKGAHLLSPAPLAPRLPRPPTCQVGVDAGDVAAQAAVAGGPDRAACAHHAWACGDRGKG